MLSGLSDRWWLMLTALSRLAAQGCPSQGDSDLCKFLSQWVILKDNALLFNRRIPALRVTCAHVVVSVHQGHTIDMRIGSGA